MNDWEIKSRTAVMCRRVKNFIEDISRDILREGRAFDASYALSETAVPLGESIALDRKAIKEGEVWGHTWESGYFRLKARVPESWKGRAVAARLDFGGEGLIYSSAGEPLYGITNGSAFAEHYAKDVYRLFTTCKGGEEVELWVETAANNLFGVKEAVRPARKDDPDRHGTWEARVNHMSLCIYDPEVWGLYLDMGYLLNLWEDLDVKSVRAARIIRALFAVTQAYREKPENASACRAILAPELAKRADASALATTAVGHAHIDTAWLWRLRETRRKTARTYASQLDLIEKYPGYVFGASAAQHHAWMKEQYPGLYERVKKAVAAGSWEPQGGMWIEADCNLPSGESLVRQFLHGKNFWKDEFGVDVRNCWIPDVFGYSGSMPQILKKSGVDFFLTQKLSWSKFNEFPHDTFRWRGIDGTEVVTHFPPEYTYNSYVTPDALRRAEKTFHEKDFLDEFITLMGIGDGGGGPKEEHLEHVLRSRDLESVPKTSFGRADALFERLAAHAKELDVWVGELYLEYHRGTYTTQARTKRNNRRLEQEIRAVEALWTAVGLDGYPRAEFDAVVKTLLLHQFHDIIPGSSIHAVYEDAEVSYREAFAVLEKLGAKAAERLLRADSESVTLFNCLASDWEGAFEFSTSFGTREVLDATGKPFPAQVENGRTVARIRVPAMGFVTFRVGKNIASVRPADREGLVLENALVRYRFNQDGEIVEALDKRENRAILKPGAKGNVISYYQDTPHNFDAWDIDYYYKAQLLETAKGVSHEALECGPVRSGILFEKTVGKSRISQRVYLDNDSAALSFRTSVDWKESQRLLRVAFPLESLATEATCEIAYGFVKRPTHANTEWDFAKFEVCAHRWVDISDAGHGVAMINDCKYGHAVRDNVLDLALLRAPLYPDPDADQGLQEFTYAILPHAEDLVHSDVIERAAALNRLPLVFDGRAAASVRTPVWFEGKGISVEALKKAEKEEAWIVRLVENRGYRSSGTLRTNLNGLWIAETDLVEWTDGPRQDFAHELAVTLAPFEIRTFKVGHVGHSAL
jgi:alpha-mannosidase